MIKFLKGYSIQIEGTINDFEVMYLILNPLKSETDIYEISRNVLKIEIEEADFSEGQQKIINAEINGEDKEPANDQMTLDFEGRKERAEGKDTVGYIETPLVTHQAKLFCLPSIYSKI